MRRLAPCRGAPPDLSGPWANYVGGIEALAVAPADPTSAPVVPLGPVGRARATMAPTVGQAWTGRPWPLRTSPSGVRATDLLALDDDAVDAVEIAREPGFPPGRAGRRLVGPRRPGRNPADPRRRPALHGDRRTSPAAAAPWAAGPGRSASHRSISGSRGGEPPSRCSTWRPRASTSSPACTRGAPPPTSTTPSGRRPGRSARAAPRPHRPDRRRRPDFAVRPADVRGILARADDLGSASWGTSTATSSPDVRRPARGRRRRRTGIRAVLRLTFRRR